MVQTNETLPKEQRVAQEIIEILQRENFTPADIIGLLENVKQTVFFHTIAEYIENVISEKNESEREGTREVHQTH